MTNFTWSYLLRLYMPIYS